MTTATKVRRSLRKLRGAFFCVPATDLAQGLIGKILVRRVSGREYRGQIVETEAYLGTVDLACHASRGRTPRTEVLFGAPGRAYVYLIYGMYHMLNVVAGPPGEAQCVLIRGAIPLDGWKANLIGPGRLTREFQISQRDYGLDLAGDRLFFSDNPGYEPQLATTPRIGIDYAGHWKDAPLRFLDTEHFHGDVHRTASRD